VEPTVDVEDMADLSGEDGEGLRSMFSDMSTSIPGVDEAMSFAELMKMVQVMDFSCIVFDTAPTGHTLRLLSFPTIMEKALSKLMSLKDKFSGMLGQFGAMLGGATTADDIIGKVEQMRDIINKVGVGVGGLGEITPAEERERETGISDSLAATIR
jgi:arsenite-transporting ATPase